MLGRGDCRDMIRGQIGIAKGRVPAPRFLLLNSDGGCPLSSVAGGQNDYRFRLCEKVNNGGVLYGIQKVKDTREVVVVQQFK